MSGTNRIAAATYTATEIAARVVETGLVAQKAAGTTAAVKLLLWVQPMRRGRVAGATTIAQETADLLGPDRLAKFEGYLAALGWVRVGRDGRSFPIGVEGFTREQDERMVAAAVATTMARVALARVQRTLKENGEQLSTLQGQLAELRADLERKAPARPHGLRAANAAPGGEVLGEADYDEHLRLVLARALGLPCRSAVAVLAGCERLLWRKGRLTAERGAALLVAFRGVVDRDADLRRN
jgi:hypothetical protein